MPTSTPPLTFDPNQGCFINVRGGTYTVTCRDSNGTAGETTVTVNMAPPAPLNCQVTDIVPAICNGLGGTFEVNCSDGCPPYDLSLIHISEPTRPY